MAVGNRMLAGWGSPANSKMSAILLGRFAAPTGEPFFWGFNADVEAESTLDNETWYHLAVTELGGLVRFYINGMETASGSLTLDTPPGTTFYIGNFTAVGFISAFAGLIDEVQVYTRALSDAEVAAIFNAGNTGACGP